MNAKHISSYARITLRHEKLTQVKHWSVADSRLTSRAETIAQSGNCHLKNAGHEGMRRIEAFVDHSGRHPRNEPCRKCRKSVKRVFTRTQWTLQEAVDGLCEAARTGKLDNLQALCSAAEDAGEITISDMVNSTSEDWGVSPLVAASIGGHVPVVGWLVSNGAKVESAGTGEQKALNRAARAGHFEVVKWFVGHEANINSTDGEGRTALHEAASIGHFPMVQWLVEQGAALDAKSNSGQTALHLAAAATEENVSLIAFLVENGLRASEADKARNSALYYAIVVHNFGIVEYFLQHCPAEEKPAQNDLCHAIFSAANAGRASLIERLNQHGMNICQTNSHGRTALHEAATGGAINCVELLLRSGVSVGQADSFGTTPAIEACRHGYLDILRCLLNAGATVNNVNSAGRTAMHFAAGSGHVELLDVLLSHGGDVNCSDKFGWTPLHCAAAESHVEMVQALIGKGAAIDAKTNSGKTTRDLAIERGHSEVSQYFQDSQMPNRTSELLSAALSDYSDLLIDPKEIRYDSWRWHDNVEGSWLDSPIKVKVKESWWSANFIEELGDDVEDPFFVYERPAYGSILEYCSKPDSEVSTNIWGKLYEAAQGLQYLHDQDIIHGDLRCESIVVAANGVAKLRNFGVEDTMAGYRLPWTAPEVLSGFPLSYESDVYAFGITIVEAMRNDQNLWCVNGNGVLQEAILSGRLPPRPTSMYEAQWQLVERMCCYNPRDRLTASDVVRELEILTREHETDDEYSSSQSKSGTSLRSKLKRPISKVSDAVVLPILLADIKLMCRRDTPMDDMNKDIYNRLKDVAEQLKSKKDSSKAPHIQEFREILRYFSMRLKSAKALNSAEAARIAATRQGANNAFSVHGDLDMFIDSAGLSRSSHIHKWRELWALRWVQQQDELLDTLQDLTLSTKGADEATEQNEALKILLFELSNNPTSYSTHKPEEFMRAKSLVSSLVTEKHGNWFIPAYEVAFDKVGKISRGAFGKVYLGRWKRSQVVVKKLKLKSDEDRKAFMNEVGIWHKLYHPHIVQLFGACHLQKPFFVCEYAGHGQLDKYLRDHPNEVWEKLYEAALGLRYLHAKNIVHGDLKCNNILVGTDGYAKLTDFGLSTIMSIAPPVEEKEKKASSKKPRIGAIRWKAPEVLSDQNATFASDIYSFGMCILEAASGKYPWGSIQIDLAVQHHVVKSKKIPMRPAKCSEEAYRLVERMCCFEPSERITADKVVCALKALRRASLHV